MERSMTPLFASSGMKFLNLIYMKRTINIEEVVHVTLVPLKESGLWKILPAYEYIPSIFEDVVWFITRRLVQVPERVKYDHSSFTYTLEEFQECEPLRFILNWKIYDMCKVYIEYTSGNSTTRYFRDTDKAKDFYDSVSLKIPNRLMYNEELTNIQ